MISISQGMNLSCFNEVLIQVSSFDRINRGRLRNPPFAQYCFVSCAVVSAKYTFILETVYESTQEKHNLYHRVQIRVGVIWLRTAAFMIHCIVPDNWPWVSFHVETFLFEENFILVARCYNIDGKFPCFVCYTIFRLPNWIQFDQHIMSIV